jgi:Domain of unknown function (DUF305)
MMRSATRISRVLAGLGLLTVLLTAPDPARGTGELAVQEQQPSSFQGQMHADMAAMMQAMEAAPMSGSAEEDFLAMMIPHHQGAIAMANALLQYGRDPLVRQLAEEIIAGQRVEIESMQNRLAILRASHGPDQAADQAIGGTRGGTDASSPGEPAPMIHH